MPNQLKNNNLLPSRKKINVFPSQRIQHYLTHLLRINFQGFFIFLFFITKLIRISALSNSLRLEVLVLILIEWKGSIKLKKR